MSWLSRDSAREQELAAVTERMHRAEASASWLTGQLAEANSERARLLDLIVEMKREGFHPAPPPEQLEALTLTVPEAVELTIRDRAHKGSELESELRRWSAEMIQGGADPQAVADLILKGGGDDDGE